MSTHKEGVCGCATYLCMVLVFYIYHILCTGLSPALDPLERTMRWAIYACMWYKGANYSEALCPKLETAL